MKKVFFALVALMGLMYHQAQAQMIIDTWEFSTGVDSTLWMDISGHDSTIIAPGEKYAAGTGVLNIGFPFPLGNITHTQFSTNINGTVRLGSTAMPGSGYYSQPLGSNINTGPKIEAFGWHACFDDSCYTRMALLGDSGSRVLVIETRLKDYMNDMVQMYVSFQVQLFETGGLRVVYGESDAGAVTNSTQNGVAATGSSSSKDVIFFDFATHTASRINGNCTLRNELGTWPGKGRWYSLTPNPNACPYPPAVTTTGDNPSSITLTSNNTGLADLHILIPDAGIDTLWPAELSYLTLPAPLNPATTYTGTAQGVCDSGKTSYRTLDFSFTTGCGEVASLPWACSFNTTATCSCWDVSQYSSANNRWKMNGQAMRCGYTNGQTYNEWLCTPVFNLPDTNGLTLKFDYRSDKSINDSVAPVVDVRIAPCAAAGTVDDSAWVTLHTFDNLVSDLTPYYLQLDAWHGQRVKVAFVRTGTGGRYATIDNVLLYQQNAPSVGIEIPALVSVGDTATFSCQLLVGVDSNVQYTLHSSLLDTTATNSTGLFSLCYHTAGWDTVTVILSNAYGSDTATAIVNVADCRPVTAFPWVDDFSYQPYCWTLNDWNWSSNGQCMYSSSLNCNMLTQPIAIPSTGVEHLSFWVECRPPLMVRVSSTASIDTADYTDTVLVLANSTNEIAWQRIDFSSYAGDTVRVGLFHLAGNQTMIRQVKVDYDTLPVLGQVVVPAKSRTDSTIVCTATQRFGATEGIVYTWHSTLLDSTAVGDTVCFTYTFCGTDTITLVLSNAFGNDTAVNTVRVIDCTPATMPWKETFVDGILCWYQHPGGKFYDTNPYSGSYYANYRSLCINIQTDTAGSWIISKEIQIPSDSNLLPILTWKVASYNEYAYYHHLYSVLVTDAVDYTDTANYVTLYTDSIAHSDIYHNFNVMKVGLSDYVGRNVHIAFHNYGNQVSSNYNCLYIDDVEVRSSAVPVVKLSADKTLCYYGDTATFTATLMEGSDSGLVYIWHSSLLDSTWTTNGDNTQCSLTYGMVNGTDTVTMLATNAYGSDTASVEVTSSIISEPTVYLVAEGRQFNKAEVGDTVVYRATRNRCVTTGMTYLFHSSLLDTTITVATMADTVRLPIIYSVAGIDTFTVTLSNNYDTSLTVLVYMTVLGCPTMGVPFFEDFEGTTLSASVDCWYGDDWTAQPTRDGAGMMVYYFDLSNDGMLISPLIDLPADTTIGLQLSWQADICIYSSSNIPSKIMVSPTGGKSIDDFTDTLYTGVDIQNGISGDSVFLDAYRGQSVRIGFPAVHNNPWGYDNIRIDYNRTAPQVSLDIPATINLHDTVFLVPTLNACSPQGLSVNWHSTLMGTSLTPNPSSSGVGSEMQLVYAVTGVDTITVIVANAYGADTAIAMVHVIDCSGAAVPYFEDFSGVTATASDVSGELPSCWDYYWNGSNAAYAPHIISNGGYQYISNIPDNALLLVAGSYTGYGSSAVVRLPHFADSLQRLVLALDYRFESSSSGTLSVGWFDSNEVFHSVKNLTGHQGNYLRDTVLFADHPAANYRIALWWEYGSSWYAAVVDNIEVFVDNDIPAPAGLTADNITASCATLRWNAVTGATAYHLILPGIVDTLLADTALSVCGLDEDSDYGFGVYAHVGDEVGHFSGLHPFHTLLYCMPLASLSANVDGIVRWQYDTTGEAMGTGVALEIADVTNGAMWADTVLGDSLVYPFAIGHRYSLTARTLCGNAEAHTTLTIPLQIPASVCAESAGSSTATNERFMDNFWSRNYSQIIYPASFAAGIDTLFGIALRVSQFSQPFADTANYNYDIFLGQTDSATLSAPLTSDSLTQVAFNKRITIRSAGWIDIPFDSVYPCNPTGNLIVTLVERTSSAYSGRHYGVHTDASCTHFVQSTENHYYTNPSTLNFDWDITTDIPDIRLLGGCSSSLCLAPVAAISAVDTHHVELQWVARGSEGLWQVEYRPSGQTAWTVADTTSANSYTVGGLHAMTTYEFRVASICDGGLQYGSTLTATTPCGEISLPYHIDFRNNEIPCWIIHTGVSHSSSYGLNMYSGEWAISPLVDDNIANLYATIKTHGGSSSYYTYNYAVGVCNGDGGNLVWVDTITLSTQYGDHEHTVYFNNYSGMGDHIIIKIISGIIDLREFDLDYVDFCIPAQNVEATAITDSSAVLQWTANASGHTFAVYLDNVLQTVTSATTYSFTGLAPRTRHLAAVHEICGAGDTAAAATRYFRTQCTPTTDLPYFEEFDYSSDLYGDTIGLPPCWDSIGYSHISFSSFSGGALTVMTFYSFEDYTGPYTSHLATPLLNIPSQGARIRFKGQTGHDDVVTAGIMTDPTDASTFIPMATITYNNRGLAWYEFTTEGLDSLNSQFAVAFRWASEGSGSLDSLFVTALPEGHTVTVTANEEGVCETYGSGVYADGSSVVIGYRLLDTLPQGGHWEFLGWSDGASGNPRTLVVISDTALVALFEWVTDPVTDTMWRTVTVHLVDLATGNTIEESDVVYVEGAGRYMDSTMVTLMAHYADNPLFYGWVTTAGDTISSNPFRFIVTCDTLITAVYAPLPVGIDEVESSKWKVEIFPNPATTDVTILTQAIKQSDNQAITILDLHGRVVYTQAIRYSSTQAITIDISSLPRGVYYVRIGSVVKKLVIQ